VWATIYNGNGKQCKRVRFHYDVDWCKRYKIRGVVIGRHIFFADPPDSIPEWTFRHELEHAYQIMDHGCRKFYWKYFRYQIRYGYHRNPYEVGARAAERIPLTINEDEILCKLKDDWQQSQSVSGLKQIP